MAKSASKAFSTKEERKLNTDCILAVTFIIIRTHKGKLRKDGRSTSDCVPELGGPKLSG